MKRIKEERIVPENIFDLIELATEEPNYLDCGDGEEKSIPFDIWKRMTKQEKINLLNSLIDDIKKLKTRYGCGLFPIQYIGNKRYQVIIALNEYANFPDDMDPNRFLKDIADIQVSCMPFESVRITDKLSVEDGRYYFETLNLEEAEKLMEGKNLILDFTNKTIGENLLKDIKISPYLNIEGSEEPREIIYMSDNKFFVFTEQE